MRSRTFLLCFVVFGLLLCSCTPTNTGNPPATGTSEFSSAVMNSPESSAISAVSNAPAKMPASAQAPAPARVSVFIQNFQFTPATVTVSPGTTVTWTNEDGAPHTVTGGPLQSQTLAQGGSYSFTFKTPGTFTYHCSIHPSMTGTVTVK